MVTGVDLPDVPYLGSVPESGFRPASIAKSRFKLKLGLSNSAALTMFFDVRASGVNRPPGPRTAASARRLGSQPAIADLSRLCEQVGGTNH